jgi:L-fucose mutarotase
LIKFSTLDTVTSRNQKAIVMLKNLDPALTADVLYILRSMGHGDVVVITDTNFPAQSVAKSTTFGRPVMMDNMSTPDAMRAILSVMPLDTFVDDFAMRMQVVDDPAHIPPVQIEAQAVINAAEGAERPMVAVERFAFYEQAKQSYAIIQTGERRFYGCIMLRKGVIAPE